MISKIIFMVFVKARTMLKLVQTKRLTLKCAFILTFFYSLSSLPVFSQARLILNGAKVNIAQGAYLVVENSAPNAITRNDGHIISEGVSNTVKWNIGTTTGTYTVPFGYGDSNYLPVTFTKTAGTGSGYFLFSTYHTTWQNSSLLPTGITHINSSSGVDNSAFTLDRFWQVNAESYTIKPTLSNFALTYLDEEHTATNNTITESGLTARRWNSTASSWVDNLPASSVNTATNTLTVTSVDVANMFPWWSLATSGSNRYWVGPSASTWNNSANWSTTAGGPGNATVPGTVDAVVFDGTSDANCTLNSALTISNLTIAAGYTGIIIQGSNTITVNNTASFSGGTFSGGSGAITIADDFNLSGTSFISTSSNLDIKGNFTFTSGGFAPNNGTVRFSGSTTQEINGSQIANFNNISVTNTSSPGLRIETDQNLEGVLTLASNVIVDADGSSNTAVLKLISGGDDPTSDAAIAALPAGAQVSGNVTVQRYMTKEGANNGRIYRYVSSPVQQATVADLQNEIPVTGSFTGTSACAGCATNQSMFAYTESVITDANGSGINDVNDGYVDFPSTSNTETLIPGKGYSVFVRANILGSTLWDLRGSINSGNVTPVSFPVTFTSSGTPAHDGWNLVGNPFPSTIDWNAASGWTKTNVNATIYITDNGSAGPRYASWNGVTGTNGGSRYIATGQAFWVTASGSGTPLLQATENCKAPGVQTSFFREKSITDILRVTLTKGNISDDAVIHFREDATDGFDLHADAQKLSNSSINLSSVLADKRSVAINSLPQFNCETEIKLKVASTTLGEYRLKFSEFESFSNAAIITLIDAFDGKSINVKEGNEYSFLITSDPASQGQERFKIKFSTELPSSNYILSAADNCENTNATIEIKNSQLGAQYVAILDSIITSPVSGNNGTILLRIPASRLKAGENRITIRGIVNNCTAFVDKIIAIRTEQNFTPIIAKTTARCGEGAVTLGATGAPEQGFYNWYEDETSGTPIENQHVSVFTTPSLAFSKTYYVAITNKIGCEGKREPVHAEVVLLNAAIKEEAGTLQSSSIEGNQWYYNEKKLIGENRETLKVGQPGLYRLQVSKNGCVARAEYHAFAETELVTIHPNPVDTEVGFEIADSFQNLKEIRLINNIGQPVLNVEWHQAAGKKTGKLNLTNYSPGVYILQILGDGYQLNRKIIKQ